MISNSIQELFDGTLGDEQTAELLHSLSVNPDKRTDFRRHMALQGAMQHDRAANALTSDEDAAVWGALAGLGGASTAGGAAANYAGGLAKVLTFVLVGVAGYLLGSTTSTDIFGSGDRTAGTTAPGTSVQRPAAPASSPATSAPATNGGANNTRNTTANGDAPASTAAGSIAAPKVIYRDKVVYRDRPAASMLAADGSGGNNGASANNRASGAADGSGNRASANNPAPTQNLNTTIDNTNGANGSNSTSNDSSTREVEQIELRPNDSGTKVPDVIAQNPKPRSIDPAQAFQKSDVTPEIGDEESISSLWQNGFELSYGEYVGVLAGDLVADDMAEHDPNYSSRHFDLLYRFGDGRFGFGARLGYGTFSRVSFYLDPNIRTSPQGSIRVDPMYRVRVQPEKQTLLEFVTNYRLPIADYLGLGLEASWGKSKMHTKVGGSILLHWLLTDQIGLQASGGINRYWYSYVGEEREKLLKEGGEGTGISDKAADSYIGTSFEGRYGIFYHF